MASIDGGLCRQHAAFPLDALYFGGCLIDSASKGNAVGTAVILDFSACHHHYKGVKPCQKFVSEGNDPKCVGSFLLTRFIS